jgi:hypothetical protein
MYEVGTRNPVHPMFRTSAITALAAQPPSSGDELASLLVQLHPIPHEPEPRRKIPGS